MRNNSDLNNGSSLMQEPNKFGRMYTMRQEQVKPLLVNENDLATLPEANNSTIDHALNTITPMHNN